METLSQKEILTIIKGMNALDLRTYLKKNSLESAKQLIRQMAGPNAEALINALFGNYSAGQWGIINGRSISVSIYNPVVQNRQFLDFANNGTVDSTGKNIKEWKLGNAYRNPQASVAPTAPANQTMAQPAVA